MLYELVVWTVDKNKITGYLSTPKMRPSDHANAAVAATIGMRSKVRLQRLESIAHTVVGDLAVLLLQSDL